MSIGRGRQHRVHRVAYEVAQGAIPPGIVVCHRCDVPLCIEPSHLFLGTPADNTADMVAKGRKHTARDVAHPATKITHAQREDVRRQRAAGAKLTEIAAQYGVCFQVISAICRGDRNYGAA